MFIKLLRNKFKNSKIFNFNVVNRDAWVACRAKSLVNGSRVLDAGAGSCTYRDLFSHCEYKTQDFTALKGVQLSGKKYGEIDYVCDILQIPVSDSSFDAILCTEVLEHLPDPIKVVKEFSRILNDGGKLFITAPLGSGIHQEPYHYYGGYTPYWYEKFLTEAGFINITVEENCGSLMACGQESARFIFMSRPFKLSMPIWMEILWAPIWLLLLPFMAVLAPISSYILSSYEKDSRFTIGYHVCAEKQVKS